MTTLDFQSDSGFKYEPKNSRSKYRDLVLSAIDHFNSNPDKNTIKLIFDFASDADNVSRQCRLWIKSSENLVITRRKEIVYFLRN